jgi:hypothetical protein
LPVRFGEGEAHGGKGSTAGRGGVGARLVLRASGGVQTRVVLCRDGVLDGEGVDLRVRREWGRG